MRRNKVTIDAKTRIDKRGNTRKNGLSTKISVLNVLCTNALIGYIIYDEVYCCDVEWGGVGWGTLDRLIFTEKTTRRRHFRRSGSGGEE